MTVLHSSHWLRAMAVQWQCTMQQTNVTDFSVTQRLDVVPVSTFVVYVKLLSPLNCYQ